MSAPLGFHMYICSLLVSYYHDLSGISLETASALKNASAKLNHLRTNPVVF